MDHWRLATPPVARVGRIAAAALVLLALLPAAAQATPSPDQCAGNRVTIFSAPVPAGLRTVGTHGIQWKVAFTDGLTGDVIVDDQIFNEITIDAAAPAYPNNVLIRLVSNTTLVAGNEVIRVSAMRPTQPASMHVQVSWVTSEPLSATVAFRYQMSRNRWSDYQNVAVGPVQSFCVETHNAIWHRQYGWS